MVVGRNTTGPGHPLFIRFQNEWGNICGHIDYTNLCRIDVAPWQGTFMMEVIEDVKLWCYTTLRDDTFDDTKRSYRDLLQSIAAYLDAPLPPGQQFRVKKPKPVSNARFGEPAQYYLGYSIQPTSLAADTRGI